MTPPSPVPPPRRARPLRFVLLCHQRSGSNALGSLLERHPRVALYGQLFNNTFAYRRYLRADLGLPLFRAHPESRLHFGPSPPWRYRVEQAALRFVGRETRLERYLDTFWERFPAVESTDRQSGLRDLDAVGFKLHDYQLLDDDLRDLAQHHVDRVVVLVRRNLLKAAVSWATAVDTGVWVSRGSAGTAADRKPVTLDLDAVRWFVDKTRREAANWRALLSTLDVPTLELEYERHVDGDDLDALFDFLGTEAPTERGFTTRRLSSPRYEHVANARAIDDALGDPETGFLFDAPGA